MKLNKLIGLSGLAIATVLGSVSCKKDYLETRPTNQVSEDEVFATATGAKTIINGVHRSLYDADWHDRFGMPSINMSMELMADDFGLSSAGSGWFIDAARYTDYRSQSTEAILYVWQTYYNVVNNVNFVLKHIDNATGTDAEKSEVKGQAYALRAWAYFQLLQSYQFAYGSPQYAVAPASGRRGEIKAGATTSEALGLPIYLEPTKEGKPRASMDETILQIENDLKASIASFENGAVARSDKSQININVTYGLMARLDLYRHKWQNAHDYAMLAVNGFTMSQGNDLLDGFNSLSNGDWIWGYLINAEQNGIYASWMAHMDNRLRAYTQYLNGEKIVNLTLLRQSSLDPFSVALSTTDVRFNWWQPVTPNPVIKPANEYSRRSQLKFYSKGPNSFLSDYPMMRVSEMYLIAAEARALDGQVTQAKELIKEFGLKRDPNYADRIDTLSTKDAIVHEIWRQRRLELWGEGFRFFDAKRQMVKFAGVTPKESINRSAASFPSSIIGSETMQVQAGSNLLNFVIPGSEVTQNAAIYQNP